MTTILLVDDSPTIRSITKVYLMEFGAEFVEAEQGERGLQLARLLKVDLVIADVMMPGMDGLAFTRALRLESDEKVRQVPVILLTSNREDQVRREGLGAGANDFITKPVKSKDLCDVVRRLLTRRAA